MPARETSTAVGSLLVAPGALHMELRREGRVVFESLHLGPGGRLGPVEVASHAVELDGRPHVLASVRDISARLEAERTLRERDARYRTIVQHTPVVQFGTAAGTISGSNGATPTYTAGTCASTYCHGKFTGGANSGQGATAGVDVQLMGPMPIEPVGNCQKPGISVGCG